jgi:hypothetical protein
MIRAWCGGVIFSRLHGGWTVVLKMPDLEEDILELEVAVHDVHAVEPGGPSLVGSVGAVRRLRGGTKGCVVALKVPSPVEPSERGRQRLHHERSVRLAGRAARPSLPCASLC